MIVTLLHQSLRPSITESNVLLILVSSVQSSTNHHRQKHTSCSIQSWSNSEDEATQQNVLKLGCSVGVRPPGGSAAPSSAAAGGRASILSTASVAAQKSVQTSGSPVCSVAALGVDRRQDIRDTARRLVRPPGIFSPPLHIISKSDAGLSSYRNRRQPAAVSYRTILFLYALHKSNKL